MQELYMMTDQDVEAASWLATMRQRMHGGDSGISVSDARFVSAMGDIAFVRAYGSRLSLRDLPLVNGKPFVGHPVNHGETRFSIQATEDLGREFVRVLNSQTEDFDVCVLVYLDRVSQQAYFIGWATRDDILNNPVIVYQGRAVRFCHELRSMYSGL